MIVKPRCSMVLDYLATFTPKINQFCRSIYQHHGSHLGEWLYFDGVFIDQQTCHCGAPSCRYKVPKNGHEPSGSSGHGQGRDRWASSHAGHAGGRGDVWLLCIIGSGDWDWDFAKTEWRYTKYRRIFVYIYIYTWRYIFDLCWLVRFFISP